MIEVANCSALRYDPLNDAVRVDLLDDGFCHKKVGAYTGCLAHNMHNWPDRALGSGGVRRAANLAGENRADAPLIKSRSRRRCLPQQLLQAPVQPFWRQSDTARSACPSAWACSCDMCHSSRPSEA